MSSIVGTDEKKGELTKGNSCYGLLKIHLSENEAKKKEEDCASLFN